MPFGVRQISHKMLSMRLANVQTGHTHMFPSEGGLGIFLRFLSGAPVGGE